MHASLSTKCEHSFGSVKTDPLQNVFEAEEIQKLFAMQTWKSELSVLLTGQHSFDVRFILPAIGSQIS